MNLDFYNFLPTSNILKQKWNIFKNLVCKVIDKDPAELEENRGFLSLVLKVQLVKVYGQGYLGPTENAAWGSSLKWSFDTYKNLSPPIVKRLIAKRQVNGQIFGLCQKCVDFSQLFESLAAHL